MEQPPLTGLGLICLGALFYGLVGAGVAQVDPGRFGHGITYPLASRDQGAALVAIAMVAAGTALAAGLPCGGGAEAHTGAVGQVLGAAVLVGAAAVSIEVRTAVCFGGPVTTGGPGDPCCYESCWPVVPQLAGRAAPVLLTAAVMIAAALVARRLPWWTRALAPALTWLAAAPLLRALWTPYLLVLQGPPP